MNDKEIAMQTYKVYQLQISDAIYDDVNLLGHSGAAKKHPAYEARLAVQFGGSEKFEPRFLEHYSLVCEIDAHDLEHVFEIGNIGGGEIRQIRRMHSISVGDIVELKGRHFMVDSMGFNEVMV